MHAIVDIKRMELMTYKGMPVLWPGLLEAEIAARSLIEQFCSGSEPTFIPVFFGRHPQGISYTEALRDKEGTLIFMPPSKVKL